MSKFLLSGFSDEIDSNVIAQFECLNKLGISYFEPRGIDEKNIGDLDDNDVAVLLEKMKKYNIKVSSLGSPIGKIQITDDFAPHIEKLKRVIKTAKMLGTKYVRTFSFYIPEGQEDAYREEVMQRLYKMVKIAEEEGIILLHENEKNIYGATSDRVLDILSEMNSPNLKCIFDPANFLQCGEQPYPDAFKKLKPHIAYIHIKDCDKDDNIVAAGKGEGRIPEMLKELKEDGYSGFLSLEPHLGTFDGLKNLEIDDKMMSLEKSSGATFTYAYETLKEIIDNL